MMDGGFDNPSINLHKEWINSSNIVGLFEKYKVPKNFDHMTIDIDLTTLWEMQVSQQLGCVSCPGEVVWQASRTSEKFKQ